MSFHIGEKLCLVCAVHPNPYNESVVPVLEWSLNGNKSALTKHTQQLAASFNETGKNGWLSVVQIDSSTDQDIGVYECKASFPSLQLQANVTLKQKRELICVLTLVAVRRKKCMNFKNIN